MIDENLFDPMPSARPGAVAGRPRRPPVHPVVVRNDGSWSGLAQHGKRPADFAHLIECRLWGGAVRTCCGLVGRPLAIDAGTEVNACPRRYRAAADEQRPA